MQEDRDTWVFWYVCRYLPERKKVEEELEIRMWVGQLRL